jgi:CheY-like chemotaxis protein
MPTLLLADDNVTVQRVIGLTFATEDFRIVTVSDGQAAIDCIKSQPPDIVLAGAAMPNVSGYDVASFVRSQPALKTLPVLLLTDAFEIVDPARLETSGANGVLEKPLDPTAVISRVKELLGIKGDTRVNPAPGRLVTSDEMPIDRKERLQREAPASSQARQAGPPPVRAAKATSWDELRASTGLAPDARSVEGGNGSDDDDYLDTLDAAFDSLDRKLAGRGDARGRPVRPEPPPRSNRDGRNPAPPLAHRGTAVDPRSPNRRPVAPAAREVPAVHEVPAASATFAADDDWFAEDEKDQEERLAEQKVLAAEMGIIEMPDESGPADAGAPNTDLNFEFGPDGEPKPVAAASPPPEPERATAPRMPDTVAPMPGRGVADDFAALLAFEQGEHPHPPVHQPAPAPAPVIVQAAPPEITDAMLEQIADRVAERLNAGSLGDQLREAMTATIRDTVRAVVSETSERLVRDEIARVKAQAERDTT